jgi:drug/metabolite transporter (DMT)-like permease
MSVLTVFLILLAAALHAGWNALLRAGADRLWAMTIMAIATAGVCGVAAFLVPVPAVGSWGYAALSALLHVGYNLFLIRTYRSGDLGQAYPISRGSSPMLVSIGAALFAGELPDAVSLLGVVLISASILSLAFQGKRMSTDTLLYALGTGCFIGAYSVIDGLGARRSGTPLGYTVWMCLLWGLLMPPVYVWLRDGRSLVRGRREMLLATGGGVVSLLAYGIVILAMSVGPMGPVSALRETSVVFAALLGRFFLNERLTVHRLTACVCIAVGALCIGHGNRNEKHGHAATRQELVPEHGVHPLAASPGR